MGKHLHGGDIYRHRNVLDFSSNCNPLGTPKSVTEAICKAACEIEHYPDVECTELRNALAKQFNIDRECFFCGNGAADVIFAAVLALKPKKALLLSPTFAEYEQALRAVDCDIEFFELSETEDFVPGGRLLEHITDEIDMLFVCNPNNPTGVLLQKDFVLRIAEKCKDKGVFLLLDECFLDFTEKPQENTMLTQLSDYPKMMILKAFTKLYAMAGVRLGYGICADKCVLEKMHSVVQPWNVSIPAQAAGVAALSETEYAKTSIEYIRLEKKRLIEAMTAYGYTVYGSEANYVFFKGSESLWEDCLARGILLRDCGNYRGLEKGFYRIAVRLREENDRLLQVLKELEVNS